jgi:hypothetical protein
MSQAQLEKKVKDYLRKSQALEDYWQRPISAKQLQAEMDRMAQHSKQPEVLQELFEALRNDPFVIAECLAGPALAERLVTNWFAYDQRIHGELKQRAEAELQAHPSIGQMKHLSGKYTEIEFVRSDSRETVGQAHRLPKEQLAGEAPALQRQGSTYSVKVNVREWDKTVQKLAVTFNEPGRRLLNGRDPAIAGSRPVDLAEGYETIPIGKPSPLQEDESRYYIIAVIKKTNDRLKVATVSWQKEPVRTWLMRAENHFSTATVALSSNYTLPAISSGGCIEDTWTATASPPDPRNSHTAVWTGSEMIAWGGQSNGTPLNTGGRYTPATDTWTPTNISGAPTARSGHSAVLTGNEMIVWGGYDGGYPNTGGRYNPSTDSWIPTTTTNAPDGRNAHTAISTGSQMIIWGGAGDFGSLNTGGRYDPNNDNWTATSTTNVPSSRYSHTAVWTGSEMIVWGGNLTMLSAI